MKNGCDLLGIFNIRLYFLKLTDKIRSSQFYINVRFVYAQDGSLINVVAFHG